MSKNTSPTIEKTQVNSWVVKPQDFVRFIYNSEVRIGVVHKITEKNIVVETSEGFRSFTTEKIRQENSDTILTCIVKNRGRKITHNGLNWTSQGE